MNRILSYICSLLLLGCGLGVIPDQGRRVAKTPLELGLIGQYQWEVTHNGYRTNGVPVLSKNIRIEVTQHPFSRSSYKQYTNAVIAQGKSNTVPYVDSLEQKPSYVRLRIMDKIGMLQTLNSEENEAVLSYLKNSKNNTLISEVSTVFPENMVQGIKGADQLFLVQNKDNKYELQLMIAGQKPQTIPFSKATLFSYSLSRFCWIENDNGNIEIVDIVEEGVACPNNSVQHPSKLAKKKEERYDRF